MLPSVYKSTGRQLIRIWNKAYLIGDYLVGFREVNMKKRRVFKAIIIIILRLFYLTRFLDVFLIT